MNDLKIYIYNFLKRQRPWCYTINPDRKWEYCDKKQWTNCISEMFERQSLKKRKISESVLNFAEFTATFDVFFQKNRQNSQNKYPLHENLEKIRRMNLSL